MTALAVNRPNAGRDWGKLLTLGFIEDRNGKRRQVSWGTFMFLGLGLTVFSGVAIHRVVTTHIALGVWLLAIGYYAYTNLSITVYYHRFLTHRGFKMARPVQIFFAIGAGMAWQGSALDWVTDHRRHHAKADIVGEDPHSPWEYSGWKGLLWAQWIWLFFQIDRPDPARRARDLRDDKIVMHQSRWYGFPVLATLSLVIPFLVYGWDGVLVAGVLRIAVHMTVTGFINSWCHMWGNRPTDSLGREYLSDDSRNSLPVAVVSMGEGNHGGHHADPESPWHGWKADIDPVAAKEGVKPNRRWQPDFTWRVIQLLIRLGLASDPKLPEKLVYFNNREIAPKKELRAVHEGDRSRGARRAAKRDRKLAQPEAVEGLQSVA